MFLGDGFQAETAFFTGLCGLYRLVAKWVIGADTEQNFSVCNRLIVKFQIALKVGAHITVVRGQATAVYEK